MKSVLLFRSPSLPLEEDRYHKELLTCGFQPYSIPVLSFVFDNQEDLAQKLKQPNTFGGLILTSQRAVDAIEQCISNYFSPDEWTNQIVKEWQQLAVFVVGKATGKAAKEKLELQSSGQEAGSAEALVPIILQTVQPNTNALLFPSGNLRRETIPSEMSKAGIVLDGLQVYSTCVDPNLKQSLQRFIEEKGGRSVWEKTVPLVLSTALGLRAILKTKGTVFPHTDQPSLGAPSYAVLFSPSGVNFIDDISHMAKEEWGNVKLVAIGKTTAEAMKHKGWNVTAVTKEPTPQALTQSIVDAEQSVLKLS